MSNILKARVAIKGTRPLLINHFGPDAIPLEKREKSGVSGNDPEEWRKTALATKDGQLYVPPTYIFGCLRDGGRYTAVKRGTLQARVAATLQVLGDEILIDRWFPGFPNGEAFDVRATPPPPIDQTQPLYLYVCSVKNPVTKGRNVRYRVAASVGWRTEFLIVWDKTVVDRNQMQAVVNDAGLFCGLGDARSIGFGRFSVESFEICE